MILSDMQGRVSAKLDEIGGPIYYPAAAIAGKLNEASRLFALLTLGLETTAAFTLAPATTYYHMLATFPLWILPLRVYRAADGVQLRPARIADLDSLDATWENSPGAPVRYSATGFDLFSVYQQPAESTVLNVTYARAPAALVNPGDAPEFPEEYHPALVDYAVYASRFPEGGGEFEKTLPYLQRFLTEAQRYAGYVRSRNIGARYQKLPFELQRFDLSKMFAARPDLVPKGQTS